MPSRPLVRAAVPARTISRTLPPELRAANQLFRLLAELNVALDLARGSALDEPCLPSGTRGVGPASDTLREA